MIRQRQGLEMIGVPGGLAALNCFVLSVAEHRVAERLPCSCRFQHPQNLKGTPVFSSVLHISLHSQAENAAHGSRKQQTHAVRSEDETAGLAAG